MKKLILSLLLAASSSLVGYSQSVNTNAPTPGGTFSTIIDFVSTGSNWIIAPYGIYSQGGTVAGTNKKQHGKFGGGIAGLYKINEYMLTGLAIDEMDGGLTMPQATAQLQYPIKLWSSVVITPLVYSGIATSIGGLDKNNGEAIGIFGTGAALSFTKHVGMFGSYEKRTGVEGNWIKGGLFVKF